MPVAQAQVHTLNQRGEGLSQALPPLLVRAEKVAASVILGVHGRKTAGPGESFWQYRAYGFGDSTQRVDWHRSARSETVYIRENEWESANTLWVWANTGARMDYHSHLSTVTKRDRAQILAVAMASLAQRGHERVGALGSPRAAAHGRMALLRVAEWVAELREAQMPTAAARQKRAAVVLVSDFLEPIVELRRAWTQLAEAGLKGHTVQIADPAEETLPFDGRNEFLGLDTASTYLARKTENLRSLYVEAYAAHRQGLRDLARSLGWTFTVHRTDEAPTRCLLPLYTHVAGQPRFMAANSA
jgi:uncharacterized protein (DUF58 family)